MNDLNIPLFRAEIIEDKRDEDYKKGFTIEVNNVKYAIGNYTNGLIEVEIDGEIRFFPIKKNTLSIHFSDTNIKDLFFGIDNGKGASIIEALFIDDNTPFEGFAMHTHYGYVFYDKNDDWVHITKLKDIKVIGIQE